MPSLGSMIGSLFGTTQARAAANAAGAQQAGLRAAYDQGQPLIAKGFADANDWLGRQYNVAGSTLAGGFGDASSAIRSGTTGARDYLTSGYGNALSSISDMYGRAQAANQAGIDRITGYYSPFVDAGRRAQSLYDVYLGTGPGGAAGALAAGQSYAANDPGLAIANEAIRRQSASMANAAGYLGSGREAAARDRAVAERTSQEYQAYLSRLERQAGLGGQYTGQLAGYTDTAAGRSASLYGMQGNQTAALYGQQARDLAANEQLQGRSLADLVSNYTGRLANNDMAYGQSMANNASSQGQTLAQLLMSRETGLSAADAQRILAQSAAATQGMNNLIDLGKAAASIYMGVPPKPAGATTPGTAANGGWSTTATPAASPSLWTQLGSYF